MGEERNCCVLPQHFAYDETCIPTIHSSFIIKGFLDFMRHKKGDGRKRVYFRGLDKKGYTVVNV